MDNAQAKSPSFPMGHSFVEKAVNVLDYMRIGPGQSPPKNLEEIFANFGRELDQWWEHQRQSLASPVLANVATPIDLLSDAPVPQPVVLPGPIPIEIPPVVEEIPTPEPPTPEPPTPEPEPEPSPEPVEEVADPEPTPVVAPPAPLPPPKPEKSVKGKKQEKTAAEKEHEKQIYKIRKAFQQRNYQLKKQGKPPLPQPASWDTLLSQKDDTPEVDAGPNGSEDG